MQKSYSKQSHIVRERALFSLLMLSVYLIGREIPLYNIDVAAYRALSIDAENMILRSTGGDAYQYSIFSLGVTPYIFGSMIVQVVSAILNADKKHKISPYKLNFIRLNHFSCGILDFSHNYAGSYRITSRRNIRHQDIHIPVCEES